MKIKNVELETVCGITSALPQHAELEIAFWGRSNVGKSSLLNTVWGRKSLARTSSEPGKTQTINYYQTKINIGAAPGSDGQGSDVSVDPVSDETGIVGSDEHTIYMVDLPGYGYAKTSRATAAKWMAMIRRYLENSPSLRVVFLLIDSRHDPTSLDIEQFRLLFSLGFNPLIVATKVDKLKKNEKAKHIRKIRQVLTDEMNRMIVATDDENSHDTSTADDASLTQISPTNESTQGRDEADELPVIPFSATTAEGRDEIREYIAQFAQWYIQE